MRYIKIYCTVVIDNFFLLDASFKMTGSFSSNDRVIIEKHLTVNPTDLSLVDYHAVFEIDR